MAIESLSRYATNLLASLFLRMQSIFGGGESLTSDLTFCMKGRECNDAMTQHKLAIARSKKIRSVLDRDSTIIVESIAIYITISNFFLVLENVLHIYLAKL